MTEIILALLGAAFVSFVVYLVRERIGGWAVVLAAFRTVGLGALILLLFNPQFLQRMAGGPPTVLLDASLSMGLAPGRWEAAIDTALGLAGDAGTILRFGSSVSLFDDSSPEQGATRLRDALLAGVGGGGPTIIVTDGEVGDVPAIPANLLGRAGVVRLVRDTVPDAALLDVSLPRYVGSADSVEVQLTVGVWGELASARAGIRVSRGGDEISSTEIEIPASPGIVRRALTLPPDVFEVGTNVLDFQIVAAGDSEPGDDTRSRVLMVTEEPGLVVLVSPADWEGRFLFREVSRMARTGVRGFAQVQDGVWVDMRTSSRVPTRLVERVARSASVVVGRGAHGINHGLKPTWEWPAASDTTMELFEGDWYPGLPDLSSPIAGRLAGIAWDSMPPLTGVVPLIPTSDEWVGLTSRQGRRGAERPVVMGRDSAGVHGLTTVGVGLWRWAFRGEESLEAYRAVLSAGIDWLLGADVLRSRSPLTLSDVVKRGEPVVVRWHTDSVPPSVPLTLSTPDSTWDVTVSIDASGVGNFLLPPGTFTWSAGSVRGAGGVLVVESYSDEIPPGMVTLEPNGAGAGGFLLETSLRDRWWLFLVLVMAFAGEWAVRHKRGLP